MSFTITNALRWWAREIPDVLALDVDGVEKVTYRQLYDWSLGIADALRRQGVQPGDRVGVIGSQSAAFLALTLGMQFMGAVAAPLNIRFTTRELRTAIEDTTPVMVVADADRYGLAEETLKAMGGLPLFRMADVETWREPPKQPIEHHPKRDDLIALMSTSGSTAKPKFVKFTHDMVVAISLELQLTEPTVRRGRSLILSPFFTGGLYCVFEYLVLGCSVYVRSRLDPDDLLGLIVGEKINIFPTTPIFLERVAQAEGFAEADLSSLTWTTVGGARVPPALVKLYRDKGVLLRCLFGQTEAGGSWASTGKPLENPMQAGYGGPFSEWNILKDGGGFAAPGEVGEIVIRGPTVTPGYWGNDEASAQVLRDGWLRTGDLGKVDEIRSLTFVDRLKDIIISGGLNISAAEVEQVIAQVEGVKEVSVIAAEDPKFGETPLAVIHADRDIDPRVIIEHCNANLANYKVPRYVVFEAEPLPRNPSLKISKPVLREKYKGAAQRLAKLR